MNDYVGVEVLAVRCAGDGACYCDDGGDDDAVSKMETEMVEMSEHRLLPQDCVVYMHRLAAM